ncbi:MAG TPA: type II toxin-antitoxin system HicA family toxin [Gemmataceae bacterium]|nr:type II toxin-antitoxin system HicA family toxin [Gemmataceae bacterium]
MLKSSGRWSEAGSGSRVRSSHYFLQHPDGRRTVVLVHKGETIGPGLMSKILRDCGLDREQFRALLG